MSTREMIRPVGTEEKVAIEALIMRDELPLSGAPAYIPPVAAYVVFSPKDPDEPKGPRLS
ncbi:hypothetical protein G5C51_00650 [Streptomyces sp. A7024]|uniref:Uncharacterized protein n=1 Tax=Streptomyces coryli TaxID=1128680 RepID=A0A6G4TRK8_9ACTN|nr:hypothetical protein [Streptomyces coryli]NGN62422.1 hypothetical protein [Streptomyces coryli]